MNVFSVFSIVGLLAALGLGTVSSHQAIGGVPAIRAGAAIGSGAAAAAPHGAVVGTKAARRPLDTVGGSPA
jgi:hypothetical protein